MTEPTIAERADAIVGRLNRNVRTQSAVYGRGAGDITPSMAPVIELAEMVRDLARLIEQQGAP